MPRFPLLSPQKSPDSQNLVHWQQFLTEVDPKIRGWPLESWKRQDMLREHFEPRSSHSKFQVVFTLLLEVFSSSLPLAYLEGNWARAETSGFEFLSSLGSLKLVASSSSGCTWCTGQGWSNFRSRQGEAEAEPWSRSSSEACFVQMISVSDSNQKHFASLCSEVHSRSVLPSELLLLLYIHSHY